jgi:hypothetical protein
MYGIGSGLNRTHIFMNLGVYTMATTGELRAIIEDLELVDIGDAASYLGEDADGGEKNLVSEQAKLAYVERMSDFLLDNCSAEHDHLT